VSALRRKIDTQFSRSSLHTVRGAGYRLVDDRHGRETTDADPTAVRALRPRSLAARTALASALAAAVLFTAGAWSMRHATYDQQMGSRTPTPSRSRT
jgi:hypothetical protein